MGPEHIQREELKNEMITMQLEENDISPVSTIKTTMFVYVGTDCISYLDITLKWLWSRIVSVGNTVCKTHTIVHWINLEDFCVLVCLFYLRVSCSTWRLLWLQSHTAKAVQLRPLPQGALQTQDLHLAQDLQIKWATNNNILILWEILYVSMGHLDQVW